MSWRESGLFVEAERLVEGASAVERSLRQLAEEAVTAAQEAYSAYTHSPSGIALRTTRQTTLN